MIFKNRPTIGLLAPFSHDSYSTIIFNGLIAACRRNKVNLRLFIGDGLTGVHLKKLNSSPVYNIAGPENVDGLISVTGAICFYLSKQQREHYFSRFSSVPLVSLGIPVKGYPVVKVDNKSGMRKLMEHLIRVHNYRKIAFVSGPRENEEAIFRFTVYKETLEKHGIAVNPDYIGYGDFTLECCIKIAADFFEKRKITPEAIVCANDTMALGFYRELKKRNIKIPGDIALTGFDDNPEVRYTFPPITTVKQPFSKQANAAVELLLDMILNKKTPSDITLPTELIIRKSCGCQDIPEDHEFTQSKKELFIHKNVPISQTEQDSRIISEVLHKSTSSESIQVPVSEEELKQVYSVLQFDLSAPGKTTLFINLLKEKLYHEQVTEEEITGWEKVLKRLFFSLKPARPDSEFQKKADLKKREAIRLLNEIKKLQAGRNKYKSTSKYYWPLRRRFDRLSSSHYLKDFLESIKESFIQLGINCFYLALYSNNTSAVTPREEHQKKATLFFGYNGKETVYYPGGIVIETADLVPQKDFKFAFQNVFIIYSLAIKDLTYGYILFEFNENERGFYDIIQERLCSALDSIRQFDIIDNKVKERTLELEAANKKLEHLDTLKNDFTANITHELRTPLTLILSPLESLLAGDLGKSIQTSDPIFQAMHTNSSRLLRLINTLLDFSKLEAGKMVLKKKKTGLNKLLHFFVSSVKSGAQSRDLTLDFAPCPEEIIVAIDRDLMEKAFFNLLSNAMKFSPPGGTIRIILEREEQDILIKVSDQGIGIPRSQQLSIFERFSQVERNTSGTQEGTGIGLAFTKEIIGLHQGTINVESDPGKGSTFIIRIPIREKEKGTITDEIADFHEVKQWLTSELNQENNDPQRETKADLSKKTPAGDSKSILIVEDNSSIRNFIKSLLSTKYTIITAENGKSALEMIENELPDLIISDVMMPLMDGLELCRHLKTNRKTSGIPLILLTARTDITTKLQGLEQKADDYLLKPFNTGELFARIENLLEKRRLELSLQKAKDALWSEMETAKKIQTSMLPVSPVIPGFDIACYLQSAAEVGGDYYDVINTGNKSWLVIGDVSGHGVTAGLVMMMVQTAIITLLHHNPDRTPAGLLSIINKTIKNNIRKLGQEKYMTINIFALAESGRFIFSGLHQDIYIYRAQTDTVDILETRGMWIGFIENISHLLKNDSFSLTKGDTLLLYTDGITEAVRKGKNNNGKKRKRFGNLKLLELFRANGKKSPGEIKEVLTKELTHYICDDDFTFMIVQKCKK